MDERVQVKAKVLVVDESPIFRDGLADLINRQEDMECCGLAVHCPGTPQGHPGPKAGFGGAGFADA